MKEVQFTEEDQKWVSRVVEMFIQGCEDEKISPIAIHAALTILLKQCNDILLKDGIVVDCIHVEDDTEFQIPKDRTIN